MFEGTDTVGLGLTVMVNVFAEPIQFTLPLLKEGVTVTVATIGVVPELVAVKDGIAPFPDVIPIDGVLFV